MVGSTMLYDQGAGTSLTVNTNTAAGGFDLGNFNNGGSGVGVILHEEGHFMGLGHAGPYNGSVDPSTQQFSQYDTHQDSLMSYIGANDPTAQFANANSATTNYGDSTTWMPLDILAVRRLYGAPTTGPLTGGQTFGYHDNVDGTVSGVGIHDYFDFSAITTPVVTLYDSGTGNTLDLSGDHSVETIDLQPGDYSSFAGDTNNLAIAYGTKIDTFVGGTAGTNVTVNSDADTIIDQGTNNTVHFSGALASYVVATGSPGTVTVTKNATGITDTLSNVQTLAFSDQTEPAPPCFARGTRIATPQGEVLVETLTAGDLVLTAAGEVRAVRWVGHRRVNTSAYPHPVRVWPVCVQVGAFRRRAAVP